MGRVSLATIRKRLGHASINTTVRYAEQADTVCRRRAPPVQLDPDDSDLETLASTGGLRCQRAHSRQWVASAEVKPPGRRRGSIRSSDGSTVRQRKRRSRRCASGSVAPRTSGRRPSTTRIARRSSRTSRVATRRGVDLRDKPRVMVHCPRLRRRRPALPVAPCRPASRETRPRTEGSRATRRRRVGRQPSLLPPPADGRTSTPRAVSRGADFAKPPAIEPDTRALRSWQSVPLAAASPATTRPLERGLVSHFRAHR